MLALAFGSTYLGKPSFWHDELVHLYVAKNILATGMPLLPSGQPYPSGLPYNYLLALFIGILGDGEAAARLPAVLVSGCNVLLIFVVLRPLLGRGAALVAAFSLALSPWAVGWAREARFYSLQQGAYLVFIGASWRVLSAKEKGAMFRSTTGMLGAYIIAVLTAFHSIFFLAPLGLYAFLTSAWDRGRRVPWSVLTCGAVLVLCCGLALKVSFTLLLVVLPPLIAGFLVMLAANAFGSRASAVCWLTALLILITLAGFYHGLPKSDHDAIFKEGGLTGWDKPVEEDRGRADTYYYPRFFANNLSRGFLALAVLGYAWMIVAEGRRGLYVALAFLTPMALLSFIGYREHRFLFFAYPFYVAAHSYALVQLLRFLATVRQAKWRWAVTAVIVLFLARVAVSAVALVGDSVEAASGADTTLARRHPQWREPCAFVNAHGDGVAIITTTYLPVLYYTGRVDDWFPSRIMIWEVAESGMEGLRSISELEEFMKTHPRGYFLAEYKRFEYWRHLGDEVAWVQAHMRRVDEASSKDVTVYAWGDL